jgi:hypothetical protein
MYDTLPPPSKSFRRRLRLAHDPMDRVGFRHVGRRFTTRKASKNQNVLEEPNLC